MVLIDGKNSRKMKYGSLENVIAEKLERVVRYKHQRLRLEITLRSNCIDLTMQSSMETQNVVEIYEINIVVRISINGLSLK